MSGPDDLRARIDALVRANIDDVMSYFQRRLLNNADAAEAVGELLFLTWKLRRRVPGDPTEGRMWLFAAAHNVLRGTRRSLSRRSAAVDRLVQDARTWAAPEWDDTALEVQLALRALSVGDAELVRLTYWDGFSSDEAATIIGVNASTARSRLSRARDRLRVALDATRSDAVGERP